MEQQPLPIWTHERFKQFYHVKPIVSFPTWRFTLRGMVLYIPFQAGTGVSFRDAHKWKMDMKKVELHLGIVELLSGIVELHFEIREEVQGSMSEPF
ncbi:MAG: hypothetical protein LBT83_03525 [Tannerella sp.]|jgi:hypothetical protein|nr:hypothetical protein [Tannerella sp.]